MSLKKIIERDFRDKGIDLKLSWRIKMFMRMKEQLEVQLEVIGEILEELDEKSREEIVLDCGRKLKIGDVSELSDEELGLLKEYMCKKRGGVESFEDSEEKLCDVVDEEISYREEEMMTHINECLG